MFTDKIDTKMPMIDPIGVENKMHKRTFKYLHDDHQFKRNLRNK